MSDLPIQLRAQAAKVLRERRRRDRFASYRTDPCGYARDVLGLTLTADQETMLGSIAASRRTAVKASHAIGKCVAFSEMIPLEGGRRARAGNLVGKSFSLYTLGEGGPRVVRATAEYNAIEPVYAVTTESGRRIVRNAEHPLWSASLRRGPGIPSVVSPKGWTPLGEIGVGDVVAVPGSFPCRESDDPDMQDEELILVAYLLGDGGYIRTAVVFTQQDNRVLAEFRRLIEAMGCRATLSRHRPYDWRITGTERGINPAMELLRRHAMMGKHSRDKRAPEAIFGGSRRQVALFLSRLFATDGWACVNRNGSVEIGYCSASHRLCLDVQELLLKLGVCSNVARKRNVEAWTLYIHDTAQVLKFCSALTIFGKEEAQARCEEAATAKAGRQQIKKWRSQSAPPGTRWERVISVESAGVEPTVAIEVPDGNTFLTTFWEHNTACAAIACSWWYDCWDRHIAYVTAPNWNQALGLTFKQLKMFRRRVGLPGDILETGLVRDTDPDLAPAHFVKALNAESGEGFQGEHSAPILIVIEEAPGVPHYIWSASDGLMTNPDARIFAVGNPTDEATNFGIACNSAAWKVLTVSVLAHPNIHAELRCEPPPYPDAVRLLWLLEMLQKDCEPTSRPGGASFEYFSTEDIRRAIDGIPVPDDAPRVHYLPNAVFQGRCLGEFPSLEDEQVIPRAWLSALPVLEPSGMPEAGLDVARFGTDRSVIAGRRGPCLLELVEVRQMSTEAVAGATIRVLHRLAADAGCDPRSITVRVDVTGGLGAGPADRLRAEGYRAVDVNFASEALDKETYPNRRSELWFTLKDRARTKELDLSRVPASLRDDLVRELSTPKWKPDGRGRKVVEDKKEFKKRLGFSPDLAEAVNLAFSFQPPMPAPRAGGRPRLQALTPRKSAGTSRLSRIPSVARRPRRRGLFG